MTTSTILVVRSTELGWEDLVQVVRANPQLSLVGDTTDPAKALYVAKATKPDFVFAAAQLESRSVIPLLSDIKHEISPEPDICIFTQEHCSTEYASLVRAGIAGYFLWRDLSSVTLHHFVAGITSRRVIMASRSALSSLDACHQQIDPQKSGLDLSEREHRLLLGLAAGLTREEIAGREGVSVRTVKRAVCQLEEKLDAPCMFLLGAKAAALNLISPE